MTAEEYLTISEVAAICKVSRDTIKDRMRKGVYRLGVHYFRPGSARPRFKKSALIAWMEGEDVKTGERQRNKKSGKLAFRIFWNGFPGGGSWETTNLRDTAENRRLTEAQAVLIANEIKKGTFDYCRWFPFGNKAYLFQPHRCDFHPG